MLQPPGLSWFLRLFRRCTDLLEDGQEVEVLMQLQDLTAFNGDYLRAHYGPSLAGRGDRPAWPNQRPSLLAREFEDAGIKPAATSPLQIRIRRYSPVANI